MAEGNISGKEARIDLFQFLEEINAIAKKDPSSANDRARRFLGDSEKQKEITDFQREALRNKEAMSVYPNLIIEVKKDGSISIIAKKKPINKKAIAAVAVISLLVIAGIFAYTTFIQEHPLEEINFEVEDSVMQAGNSFKVDLSFTPKNASSKDLKITCNHPDVEIINHGSSLEIIAGSTINTGDVIKIHAKNDKYNISKDLELEVENNISLLLKSASLYHASGEKFVINCISNVTDLDLEPVWNVSKDWVILEPNGASVNVQIKPGIKEGSEFTISAYLKNTTISVEQVHVVSEEFEFNLKPSSSKISAGIPFEIVVESSDKLTNLTWSVDKNWIDINANGTSAIVTPDISAKKGSEFTITAKVPNTELEAKAKFYISEELEIILEPQSEFIQAGNSLKVDVKINPKNHDVKLAYQVDNENVSCILNGNEIVCNISSKIFDGEAVTLTAYLEGYDVSDTISFKVSNPNRVLVNITNESQFKDISKDPDGFYSIKSNITLTEKWIPFAFSGELYGNNNVISGLKIDYSNATYSSLNTAYDIGLFSVNGGIIDGIRVTDAEIVISPNNWGEKTTINSGVIAGKNTGKISNCVVENCEIISHSSNINTLWTSMHELVPSLGVSSKSEWKEYATLKFTNKDVKNWAKNKAMIVNCGGISGINNGSIKNSSSKTCDIDAMVINFHYDGNPKSAKLYAGGIVGMSDGSIQSCSSSSKITATLNLHDCGEDGLGYVGDYVPHATGYVGGISGYGSSENSEFTGSLNKVKIAYAPVYLFLQGADYGTNKGKTSNLKWISNDL